MQIEDCPERVQKCIQELKKLGAPVKDSHSGSSAYFSIDAEEPEAHYFLDYYSNYWGSKQLNKILEKHGLYFEWENTAWTNVYDL